MAAASSARSLATSVSGASARAITTWASVPMAPPDAIFGVTERFKKDSSEKRINLSVGAYRDEHGKAEKQILDEHVNHEYANMAGVPGFADVALKFILGEAKDSRPIAAVQSLSGTGALRLAGHFLHEYSPGKTLYLPTPTWGNHNKIFAQSSVPVNSYKYYDPETIGLDFDGMKHDIKQAPGGSVILLHACAHNPTGIDPSPEQWKELSDLIKDKEHLVLFDSAYQGFASGDAEADAFAVRLFLEEGHSMIIAQSFSKNFGLYGERVGALSVTAQSEDEADRITSQLKAAARAMYSNPPIHGAHIVKRILTDAKLESQWRQDCAHMAQRIQDMRTALVNSLEAAGSSLDWSHVTAQIGMFCYSGMSEAEVQRLGDEHHVYLTSNGRISMAGVTPDNVTYLAQAIHEVTTTLRK